LLLGGPTHNQSDERQRFADTEEKVMDPKSYLSAPCGRIAVGTSAWLVAATGVLAVLGPGVDTLAFLSVAVIVGIVGFIVAVGLAIQEFGEYALALIIALPFLGGPYFAAMYVAPGFGKLAGLALLCLAGAAGALAVWGPRSFKVGHMARAPQVLDETVPARS
jgi:hypothetical protein